MKKQEILQLVTKCVQQEYGGTLTKTFLANFSDMFGLLAEDVPIPWSERINMFRISDEYIPRSQWPPFYFLLNKKLFIILKKKDLRLVRLILYCLDLIEERSGDLKSRRIVQEYFMDFWRNFFQYVMEGNLKTKYPFPPLPLFTFQEWIELKICTRRPPFDEWRNAWCKIRNCRKLSYEWGPLAKEALTSLSPWEMKEIFKKLEPQKLEPKNQKAPSAQGSFTQTGAFPPEEKVPIWLILWKNKKYFINKKSFIFFVSFFLFLLMSFCSPRFFSRFFINFFIIALLEPQTPEWNPLIPKLRSTNLFFDYKEAKMTLRRITWGAIFIFYFFHFRYG